MNICTSVEFTGAPSTIVHETKATWLIKPMSLGRFTESLGSNFMGTFSPQDCLKGHIFLAFSQIKLALFLSCSLSSSSSTAIVKCISVKRRLSSPSAFIYTEALVSSFRNPNLELPASKRIMVFMQDASAAANTSSGTQYPCFPPNSGRGLTLMKCLPFIVRSDSFPLVQLALSSKKEFWHELTFSAAFSRFLCQTCNSRLLFNVS